MHIELYHHTSHQEAIRKTDTLVEELMRRRFPGGVEIQEQAKSWSGNAMDFSFKARKGLFSTTIHGKFVVTDSQVVLDCTLPSLVKGLLGDKRIKDVISQNLDNLFKA